MPFVTCPNPSARSGCSQVLGEPQKLGVGKRFKNLAIVSETFYNEICFEVKND
jgi:hypothetical protein